MTMFASGIIYYWITWIFWAIVTFFQRKSRLRTSLACLLLVLLILSNETIIIANYSFTISILILFSISFIYIICTPRLFYHLFISAMMIISYLIILSIELIEPVWLFMSPFLLIPIANIIFNLLFVKSFNYQVIITVFGFCLSEFLYKELFFLDHLEKKIGDLVFFDQLFMTIGPMFIVYLSRFGIKLYKQNKMRHLTPEKQIKIPS